jgi:hypothetical protein
VLVCDDVQSALAAPAVHAGRRAPRGEVVHLAGGHYEPFLDGHEQAVEAQLSFLVGMCLMARARPEEGRKKGGLADPRLAAQDKHSAS